MKTLITSRDPKGLHAVGLFEAAYNKARLDNCRAQRLNERGGEFQCRVFNLIAEISASEQYVEEEVSSMYAYPDEYKGPKPIREQVDDLANVFELSVGGTLDYLEKVIACKPLPAAAEGWFAVPSVDAVAARFFPEIEDSSKRYCAAVPLALTKMDPGVLTRSDPLG